MASGTNTRNSTLEEFILGNTVGQIVSESCKFGVVMGSVVLALRGGQMVLFACAV